MLPSASQVMPRRAPIGVLRGFRVAASVVGTAAVVVAVAALVGVGLAPRLGFYRPLTVLSGSMRPAFVPGDVVIVTPETMKLLIDEGFGVKGSERNIATSVIGVAVLVVTRRVLDFFSSVDRPAQVA